MESNDLDPGFAPDDEVRRLLLLGFNLKCFSALSAPDSSRQMLGDTWRLWLDSGGVDDEMSTWRWELLDPVTDSDSEISPAWRYARPHRAPHMARAPSPDARRCLLSAR